MVEVDAEGWKVAVKGVTDPEGSTTGTPLMLRAAPAAPRSTLVPPVADTFWEPPAGTTPSQRDAPPGTVLAWTQQGPVAAMVSVKLVGATV